MKKNMMRQSSFQLLCHFLLFVFFCLNLTACASLTNLLFKPKIQIDELWQRKTGSGTRNFYTHLKPAVTENVVYVADTTGQITAYERNKGKRLWQKSVQDNISGGVFAGYGLLIFGTQEGVLYALDIESGDIQWQKRLSSEILSMPSANGQLVLTQTLDGKLFALDQKTGDQRWVYQVTVPSLSLRGTSSPQLLDEIALAGFANGKLVAVLLETGLPVWERAVSKPMGRSELDRIVDIDGDIVVSRQMVYAAAFQGKVAAIELQSGRPVWQREISTSLGLEEGLGNIYAIDSRGHVIALDQQTGADVWQQKKLGNKKLSSPVAYSNYLVTSDEEGFLYFISQLDGSVTEKFRIKGAADNINPEAKAKARFTPVRIEPDNGIRVRSVVKDDILYVINNSGTLRALSVIE